MEPGFLNAIREAFWGVPFLRFMYNDMYNFMYKIMYNFRSRVYTFVYNLVYNIICTRTNSGTFFNTWKRHTWNCMYNFYFGKIIMSIFEATMALYIFWKIRSLHVTKLWRLPVLCCGARSTVDYIFRQVTWKLHTSIVVLWCSFRFGTIKI